MLDYRRMLMEDFSLSPEIILSCRGEIEHHCSGLHRKGRTLHCLMKVVRGEKGNVGLNCQQAVRCFSVALLLGCSVGRSTDLSVNILPCDGDSSEGSLALPGTSECWRQLCNGHGMKCNLVSSSTLVVVFFLKNTFWIALLWILYRISSSSSPAALRSWNSLLGARCRETCFFISVKTFPLLPFSPLCPVLRNALNLLKVPFHSVLFLLFHSA